MQPMSKAEVKAFAIPPMKRVMFSQRHYEAIAHAMRKSWPHNKTTLSNEAAQFAKTVDCLSNVFAKDNPKFNREMFLAACYMTPEKSEKFKPDYIGARALLSDLVNKIKTGEI